jgi:hypothetical protein
MRCVLPRLHKMPYTLKMRHTERMNIDSRNVICSTRSAEKLFVEIVFFTPS